MDIQVFVDVVVEYLQSHRPPIPEIGWHDLHRIVKALPAEQRPPSGERGLYRETFQALKDLNDSRLDVAFSRVRLQREKPWPIELSREAGLRRLVGVLRLQTLGNPTPTVSEIAESLGLAPSTITQTMSSLVERRAVQQIRKGVYRLTIDPDREIWIHGSERMAPRLTTLAQELGSSGLSSSMGSDSPNAATRALAEGLLVVTQGHIAYHEERIANHRKGIASLKEQTQQLQKLLRSED